MPVSSTCISYFHLLNSSCSLRAFSSSSLRSCSSICLSLSSRRLSASSWRADLSLFCLFSSSLYWAIASLCYRLICMRSCLCCSLRVILRPFSSKSALSYAHWSNFSSSDSPSLSAAADCLRLRSLLAASLRLAFACLA